MPRPDADSVGLRAAIRLTSAVLSTITSVQRETAGRIGHPPKWWRA
jgi:hypothetical protein